jgi:hypothetical protein
VTYASITGTTFVGCAGGTGTLATANAVFQPTTNTRHIAIGAGAIVTGDSPVNSNGGIAVGTNARAYGDDRAQTISVGINANTYSNATANSGYGGSVAIGQNSFAATRSVAIGSGVSGPGTGAYADNFSVACGYGTTADQFSAAYGTQSYAYNQSAACGYQASAIDFSSSLGAFATSQTGGASVGAFAQSNNYGVAIGPYAKATLTESVCIGGSTTLITAASNGVALPANTINVTSTQSFQNSGTLIVYNSSGASQTVTYTGPNTSTAFVGCSGGTGTLATGGIVAQYNEPTDTAHALSLVFNRQSMLTGSFSLNSRFVESYSSLIGSSGVDNRVVCWQDSPRSHFFTSTTANQVCLLPPATSLNQNGFYTNVNVTGTTITSVYTSVNSGLSTAGNPSSVYSISLPTSTIIVSSTTNFASSGVVYIRTGSGGNAQSVSYTNKRSVSTTIAALSNGVSLPSATSIEVASTTGFAASGSIVVTTTNGTYIVSYTGPNTGTTFVGCTTTGTAGTMATGGAVTQIQFEGCTGGTGTVTYNDKTGEGIVAQSVALVGYVYPSQSVKFTCVDITGALGTNGWFSTLADSAVTQSMQSTVAPSNYTSSSFGSAVNDLYRSANNNTTSTNVSTTVAGGGVSYPASSIQVTSTNGFTFSGSVLIQTSIGLQKVTYTGLFGDNTLTGCTGPVSGTSSNGDSVRQSGLLPVTSSVSGTTLTVTTISDSVIEPGMFLTGGGVLPDSQIISGTGGAGSYTIDVSQTTSVTTTIASGSNGLSLPQTVINVASTVGLFAEGSVLVTTDMGPQLVRYTGPNTATTIVGCTGGTGTMSTGGNVSLIIAPTNIVFNYAAPDKLYTRTA